MLTLDAQIDRIAAYLSANGISLRRAADMTGTHRNTVLNVFRNRKCRLETLRALAALVPADFDHASSPVNEEGQAGSGCSEPPHSATKICASEAA